jgi:hypothetical protein
MSSTTAIHPDELFRELIAKGKRAQVQRALTKLHDICRKQHELGSRDFSVPRIGRLGEAEGLFKARVLYNATSKDYVALIKAWAAYVGPPVPPPPKDLASYAFLPRIEDPALRSIVQTIIADRDTLRAQVNQLKATTVGTVDRRPLGATIATNSSGKPFPILEMSAQLTEPERESLKKAASKEYLNKNGFDEGPRGEVLNDKGRVVFPMGFLAAIRRILGE